MTVLGGRETVLLRAPQGREGVGDVDVREASVEHAQSGSRAPSLFTSWYGIEYPCLSTSTERSDPCVERGQREEGLVAQSRGGDLRDAAEVRVGADVRTDEVGTFCVAVASAYV